MEFIWHDGGRAAAGFVGLAGDCVTRAISVATGEPYKDVYDEIGRFTGKTARRGVVHESVNQYLAQRGWQRVSAARIDPQRLPHGVVLVRFRHEDRPRGHLSCLIDHTVYDTWNPYEDEDFEVVDYWTLPHDGPSELHERIVEHARRMSDRARRTRDEFERILKRVRALDRTASNQASTEGEVRNALRAMQALMLEHNLTRDDLVDDAPDRAPGMTRRACPLNSHRLLQWELSLAAYITAEILPLVQYFSDRSGHRTLLWFYGPVDDVQQALELYREMLLTIATSARLNYGGYSRGSGASYAEGYVRGLPRQAAAQNSPAATTTADPSRALMQTRMLASRSLANAWLNDECGIQLVNVKRTGRSHFDRSAHQLGQLDGAKHRAPSREERPQIEDQRRLN